MLINVKCKSCKGAVKSYDKTCATCAEAEPGKGKMSVLEVGLTAALLGLTLWGAVSLKNSMGEWYQTWSRNQDEQANAKEAACKLDLECWGNRFKVSAELDCAPAVEKLAKFSARWTNDMKFSHYRWRSVEQSYISYVGDQIQFQNGFGAYQIMTYTCDYDTLNKRVIGVKAQPGTL